MYAICFVYKARVYYTLITIRKKLLLVRIVAKCTSFARIKLYFTLKPHSKIGKNDIIIL
jgi:hypothetical protein